jgi:hypothetical protein
MSATTVAPTNKPPGAWRRRYALASRKALASAPATNATETLPTLEGARSQLKTIVADKENACKYLRKHY